MYFYYLFIQFLSLNEYFYVYLNLSISLERAKVYDTPVDTTVFSVPKFNQLREMKMQEVIPQNIGFQKDTGRDKAYCSFTSLKYRVEENVNETVCINEVIHTFT